MADDRVQINLQVNETTKQEWVDFINNHPDASSLSHLIRLAVNREINRVEETNTADTTNVQTPGLDEDINDITEQLNQIQATTRSILEEQQVGNIEDLAAELYDIIPVVLDEDAFIKFIESGERPTNRPIISWDSKKQLKEFSAFSNNFREVYPSRIEDFAEALSESKYRVRQAAEKLEESFNRVKTIESRESTYVYEVSAE